MVFLSKIDSKRLNANGDFVACEASQCGGYTLEAELGIIPNGKAEPDYLGDYKGVVSQLHTDSDQTENNDLTQTMKSLNAW